MHDYPPPTERKLTQLLNPKRILVAERATDKWDAIHQLTNLIVANGDLDENRSRRALEAVYERERVSSTGIGRGFAIPHGIYECLQTEVAALGVFRNGVDFEGRYEEPSRIVLLLLYPPDARDEHLNNIASAVRLLSAPALATTLADTDDSEALFQRLTHREIETLE